MEYSEGWESQKEILIILVHPDDPEFFLGATIARWVKAGHRVRYVLLTKGDKGAENDHQTRDEICQNRMGEQKKAAEYLGVSSVDFLDYEDGYLIPDLAMRREVVRWIRKYEPDILVTCDPTNAFPSEHYINHPDHRNAGQVVIDAVFPAADNPYFFPELLQEGLDPHEVAEVWMSLTHQPNVTLDVSEHWEDRIEALKRHRSQIGDPEMFEKMMLERLTEDDKAELKYEEQFRRIKFRRPKS
jgi:LmbE family N-acetylglucosaminyl deacetylase